MKAALHALEQLNAMAWQQSVADSSVTALQLKQDQENATQASKSLDELQRSLSMPDQISADLARPLLAEASANDAVRSHRASVLPCCTLGVSKVWHGTHVCQQHMP